MKSYDKHILFVCGTIAVIVYFIWRILSWAVNLNLDILTKTGVI
jgi:hypothetical protein